MCRKNSGGRFRDFFRQFTMLKLFSRISSDSCNLFTALERLEKCVLAHRQEPLEKIKQELWREAEAIRKEDAAACRRIGEWGLSLLQPGMGILTHCNAGHLAVSEYGTALAPIYLGQEKGYHFIVYADETRPLLQGAV